MTLTAFQLLYAAIAVLILVAVFVSIARVPVRRRRGEPLNDKRTRHSREHVDRAEAIDDLMGRYQRGEIDQDTYERLVEDIRRRTAA